MLALFFTGLQLTSVKWGLQFIYNFVISPLHLQAFGKFRKCAHGPHVTPLHHAKNGARLRHQKGISVVTGDHGKRNSNPRLVGYRNEKYVKQFGSKTTNFRYILQFPIVDIYMNGYSCISHCDICTAQDTYFLKREMFCKMCFCFSGGIVHAISTEGEDQLLNITTVCLLNADE